MAGSNREGPLGILGTVSIALAIAAVGIGLYGMIETRPNFDSVESRLDAPSPGGLGGFAPLSRQLERQLRESYMDALNMQCIGIWGLAALGIVLGLIAGIKKAWPGWLGLGLSLVSVVLSLLILPAHW